MKRQLAVVVCLLGSACGGGGGGNTPTVPTPTPTPAQANRAPSITGMTMTGFGIQSITQFNYSATAADQDNDTLVYTWDLAGNPGSGTSGSIIFSTGGEGTARVTVSDGKGGTATDTRTFVVGTMTGAWRGSNSDIGPFSMSLTQTSTFISGTYADGSRFGPGQTDPAQPGSIRADGTIELRIKQARFTDFTFRGQMDQTGRRITGGIFGSGFTGQPFVMDKQ